MGSAWHTVDTQDDTLSDGCVNLRGEEESLAGDEVEDVEGEIQRVTTKHSWQCIAV